MHDFPQDIYTEPEPDVDTLANLGPLGAMAGIWTGARGLDVNPKPDGPERQAFIEHMELQPIDAQTNGPQLFYGLRYHTQIFKPDDPETFHDQVGYWLWEPATGTVMQTLTIPRGQAAMAVGRAAADARTFRLQAIRGSETNGIVSNPFLEYAFRTQSYTITVSINADGTWSYEQDTVLVIPGQAEPFHHTDRNTLRKIGNPTPNPTARAAAALPVKSQEALNEFHQVRGLADDGNR
ncbi:MAG TPA: heme-binding beta-barrel domain-containing protein [Burkholderiales bacterium]|nr:heme-binding beta-barrel domain-containing protein [Burkholderiales bacterium]